MNWIFYAMAPITRDTPFKEALKIAAVRLAIVGYVVFAGFVVGLNVWMLMEICSWVF